MERDNSVSRSITSMRQKFFSRCMLLYGIFCLSYPTQAAVDGADSHDKRAALARSFVEKLKGKLGGNDSAVSAAPDSSRVAPAADVMTQIPEGADMLFRPKVDKYTLDDDIFAIKGTDDFYFSLADLVAAFDFPITVSDDQKTASGWFVQEAWPFSIDVNTAKASARGQDYNLTEQDYRIEAGELMIAGRLIEQMLGMTYEYDLSQQYIKVSAGYVLPSIAKLKRRDRKSASHSDNVAVLPRRDYQYDWAGMSSADLSVRSNYRRSGESGESSLSNTGTLGLNGQILKNDARIFMNADDEYGLNSVSAMLSRQSDRAELLGPLKARSYSFGDTSTTDLPLTGYSSQELGARISSNPLTYVNYQDTRISGNAVPGWDVELYRENSLIDTQVVDETGRFEFEKVQLYAGDNNFDIYFYGYQGEVRKESLSIPLTAETLTAQNGTYDISASLRDTQTYRRFDSNDEDADTPHLAGRYNFFVGDALAYAGFRGWQEEGDAKLYLGTGFTNIWNGYVFDTNYAVDEQAEMGLRLGIRKNIDDWNLAWTNLFQTDQFTQGTGADNPVTFQTMASAYRSYTPLIGTTGNISLSADYRQNADGGEGQSASFGLGQGFSGVSLSNNLRYDETSPADGDTSENLMNEFSGRVRLNRYVTTRAGLTYEVKPESRMDRYFATVNYTPKQELSFDLEVEHEPDVDHTEGELRANYRHDKFRLSPFVRVDSDRDVAAGFNVSTSLINQPQGGMPYITGQRVAGDGLLSAHVFLDVNGNEVFDEGDEPLSDVIVESVNSKAREKTKDDGYVMLSRLATNLLTDIRLDAATLPDPFMVPVNRGSSILPRAGKVYEMDFPVQFAGELDGTIATLDIKGEQKLSKFVNLSLVPLDPARGQPQTTKAAQDGFYLFSQVPPGQYFLTVSAQDAKTLKAARPKPRILTFTHEGTTIYAQDILLQKGQYDIGFDVVAAGFFPDLQNAEPEYFIQTGKEKTSGILQALYNMRMKDVVSRAVAGLQPYTRGQDDESGGLYYRVGAGGLDAAYGRCQILADQKLPCRVVVVPASSGAHPVEQASL
jgi:hypothetical protein